MKFGKYKVIVCGSRGFVKYYVVKKNLDLILKNLDKDYLEIVSGSCKNSPDILGEYYAVKELGFSLGNGLRRFPAQWEVYGKIAGMIRNEEMAEYSTHCVAFWDGKSTGTKNMIENAEKYNLKLRVIEI